ncbi:hypothetical protein RBU49_10720 [Clostridium sp. MB40-C1]|uniref:hypothetical protein n=1 Tax=Clostridium sp. MB40-C1 TaxID=3070996 RepID=UPI0027DEBEA6|nr:hypothetical protein [Clostridium sp. MB40-C1]WMJ79362.1 hypothetical protein RBU49_10720 [Clostridium sp. MB40-C1]
MKFKIRSKIIIMNIIVILPVIIIIYSMILRNLHGNLFSTSLNYLQKQSYSSQIYIINYVQKEMENNLKIDTVLKNMSPFIAYYLEKDLKCQVQIIDKEMNLLGDSRDDSKFKLDEDVSNAVNGNKAYVLRKIGDRDYILFSSPIYINDKIYNLSIYKGSNDTKESTLETIFYRY